METGFTKWIIVVTVVLCVLLELIDTSIVNVALTDRKSTRLNPVTS